MSSIMMKYSIHNVIPNLIWNPFSIILYSLFSLLKPDSTFRFASFRMTLYHFFICFILLFSLLTVKSYANDTDLINSHEIWANLRIGAALGDNYLNVMTSALDISMQVKSHFFVSAYGLLAGDKFSETANFTNGKSGAEILDLGGLAGLFFLTNDFKYSFSAGLSHIRAKYDGGGYFNTLNFPLQTSAYYIGKRVGFGVTVFDNINPKINYYGVNVGVQVRFN
jgi:hypothetical protein